MCKILTGDKRLRKLCKFVMRKMNTWGEMNNLKTPEAVAKYEEDWIDESGTHWHQ